jgi:hypothetical protein
MATARKISREEILDLIPEGAVRLKVVDEKGHERWRDIEESMDNLLDTDEIVLLKGKPQVTRGRSGRRKKAPRPKPPPPTSETVAKVMAAKAVFLAEDELLRRVDDAPDSEDILHLVMRGFAQEAASLFFERTEAERSGTETSQLSIRRINALKAMGETWIKRKEQLSGKTIDMASPAFARLFAFMTETFRESMHAGGVPRDQAETVFARLSKRMVDDTWELEATKRMKGD